MSRRFAFLLPVAVIALVVAVAVGATVAATEGPTAFEVGSVSVSQAAFHDEIDRLASEKQFAAGITGAIALTTPGALDLGTTRVWMQFRIFQLLAEHHLARLDDRVRPVDRDAVDEFLGADFVEALRTIPSADLRSQFRDIVASWMAVGRVEDLDLSTDFARLGIVLGRESRRPGVGVDVEPRYGVWDARRAAILEPQLTDSSPIRTG